MKTPESVSQAAHKATRSRHGPKLRKTIKHSNKESNTPKERVNTLAAKFDYRAVFVNENIAEAIAQDLLEWVNAQAPTSIKQYCKQRDISYNRLKEAVDKYPVLQNAYEIAKLHFADNIEHALQKKQQPAYATRLLQSIRYYDPEEIQFKREEKRFDATVKHQKGIEGEKPIKVIIDYGCNCMKPEEENDKNTPTQTRT